MPLLLLKEYSRIMNKDAPDEFFIAVALTFGAIAIVQGQIEIETGHEKSEGIISLFLWFKNQR